MGRTRARDGQGPAYGRGLVVAVSVMLTAAAAAACSGDDDSEADNDGENAEAGEGGGRGGDATEPELREELLEMMDADQAERTGEVGANNDAERTDRLKEIIDDVGWPTFEQVGRDGATAAWVIAQHADQDVEFQEEALELMRAAVDDDQADPSELAYLEDRVAVNNEQPQTYGTQVRCGPDGAEPATPLADPDEVDRLRESVDLDPLADYLTELEVGCNQEVGAATG